MSLEFMVKAFKLKVGNPLRKLVLIKLADNANDKGECWPSYAHIADQCEISRRSAIEHIKALEQAGFIRIMQRRDGVKNLTNVVILTLSGGAGAALGGGAGDSPPSAGAAPGGSAGAAPGTCHSFEPVSEPVKGKRSFAYPDEFEQAWAAYPARPGASKRDAFKAWKARITAGATADQILDGVNRYARYCASTRTEPQYIKQPATFFGPGEHYLADWAVTSGGLHAANNTGKRAAGFGNGDQIGQQWLEGDDGGN